MPQISTQWRIAASMSRTTIPTCRIGPNNRLIYILRFIPLGKQELAGQNRGTNAGDAVPATDITGGS